MSFERIVNLALRAYPHELRESRGVEMRDTVLEASGASRAKLLRESLGLASAGMSARARAAASFCTRTSTLSLRAIAYRVARTYAGAWRSFLSASTLLVLTYTVCGQSVQHTAVPTVTSTLSGSIRIVALLVRFVALASFATFVISRSVSIEREGSGVRAALSIARSAAGDMVWILFVGSIALATAVNVTKLALLTMLGVVFGVGLNIGGATGGGIAEAGVVGALPFVGLLTIWSVALPVAVIEHPGGASALARSRELMRGNNLRALVVVTIVCLVAEAPHLLGGLLTGAAGEIGTALAWLPVAPIPLLAATALYLELGEAAPLPGRTT
jgi:hypothetical protein